MNNDLNNFIVKITEDDIIKEFDDIAWEDDVANAAFLGAIYLVDKDKRSPEDIIHEIINYNVLKKLHTLFLKKAKPLPKEFVWNNNTIDIETAFSILDNFVAQVSLMKEVEQLNKEIKLKITTNNILLQDKLQEWYKYFQKINYQHLNIKLNKLNKNSFVFIFNK